MDPKRKLWWFGVAFDASPLSLPEKILIVVAIGAAVLALLGVR